jgi:hypothetical protein
VRVEFQEIDRVEGALLSATTITGVVIVDVEVLAINGISIEVV